MSKIGAYLNPYAIAVMYPMQIQHPKNICIIRHVEDTPDPISKTIHSYTASEHRGMVRWAQRMGWTLKRVSIVDGIFHAAFVTRYSGTSRL